MSQKKDGSKKGTASRGKPVIGVCTYCGEIRELTGDHVPPKNLFPKPRPSNLIVVPSCLACNRDFSKDDEHFRTAVSLTLETRKDERFQQIVDKSLASFRRPEGAGLKASFYRTFRPIELKGRSGLYLGNSLAFTVSLDRVRRFGIRTIRGLYYATRGVRLPNDAIVVSVVNDLLPSQEAMSLLLEQPPQVIVEGLFEYKYLIAPDEPLASAWVLNFYHKLFICGLTTPAGPELIVATSGASSQGLDPYEIGVGKF